MGEFFTDGEKVRIDFEDGQWVDIKEELTQYDQDFLLDRMARAESTGSEAKVTLSLGRMALMERAILAWSFPEPVTPDNISRLRIRYRQRVLDEVNRLNEQAGEWVRKNALTVST